MNPEVLGAIVGTGVMIASGTLFFVAAWACRYRRRE